MKVTTPEQKQIDALEANTKQMGSLEDAIASQSSYVLTRVQAAKRLTIPELALKVLAKKGEIPFAVISGRMKFLPADIEAYVQRKRNAAPGVEVSKKDKKWAEGE